MNNTNKNGKLLDKDADEVGAWFLANPYALTDANGNRRMPHRNQNTPQNHSESNQPPATDGHRDPEQSFRMQSQAADAVSRSFGFLH